MKDFLEWAKTPRGIIILTIAAVILLYVLFRRGSSTVTAGQSGSTPTGDANNQSGTQPGNGTFNGPHNPSGDGIYDGGIDQQAPPTNPPPPTSQPPATCTASKLGRSYTIGSAFALSNGNYTTLREVFNRYHPSAIDCAIGWNPTAVNRGLDGALWNGFVVYY